MPQPNGEQAPEFITADPVEVSDTDPQGFSIDAKVWRKFSDGSIQEATIISLRDEDTAVIRVDKGELKGGTGLLYREELGGSEVHDNYGHRTYTDWQPGPLNETSEEVSETLEVDQDVRLGTELAQENTENSGDQRVQALEKQVQAVNEQLAERQQVLEDLQSQFDQMQTTMQEMQATLQEMQSTLDAQNEAHDQLVEPADDTSEEKRTKYNWKHPFSALLTIFSEKAVAGFDRYRQLDDKKKVGLALGVVGAAAAIAWWIGDFSGFGGKGSKAGDSGQNVLGMLPVKKQPPQQPTPPGGPVELFPDAARTVHHGEGWYETFKDLGIPQDQWADRLNTVGPELAKDGWAYWDEPAGEWRISQPGQLPDDVLNFIKNA